MENSQNSQNGQRQQMERVRNIMPKTAWVVIKKLDCRSEPIELRTEGEKTMLNTNNKKTTNTIIMLI